MPTPAPPPPHPDVPLSPEVWRSVLVVMEKLAASSDLEAVLGLVIDAMRDCLGADRASVFQYDRPRHELFATRAHGVEKSLRFSADLGLAGEVVRTRAIVNVPDCYADPRFNPEVDRLTGYRTTCMLTIPLVSFDGDLEGVAQVLNRRPSGGKGTLSQSGEFGAAEQTIARALASQAAVAIRRARLIDAERRKDKVEADLRVAREMQRASLPRTLPTVPGYDLAAVNRQAEETGGDTYDLVSAEFGGGGGLLILMADATGHGIGPALSATQVQAMLRMAARLGAPLDRAMVHLNSLISDTLPLGRFVTAFVGLLDPAAHRVGYVSAGQAPIVVVRADGTVTERDADIPPLGVDAVIPPPGVQTIDLLPGDTLLLLSDGYYEHLNAENRQFGVDRAVAAVRAVLDGAATHDNAAVAMLDGLSAEVARFGAGRPATDDQTAVLLRRRPTGGGGR